MEDLTHLRNEISMLQNENDNLRSQLEEYKSRFQNLKRELEIMSRINDGGNSKHSKKDEELKIQNQHLRSQLLAMFKEKEQLQINLQNQSEKIMDLRYNNGELKSLNEKLTILHQKELEMVKKQMGQDFSDRKWIKQKENLEKKLQSCAEVVRETEQYYVAELRKMREVLKAKDQDIRAMGRQLEQVKTARAQGQNNQRWQRVIEEIRKQHDEQNRQLKGKIKFLINKLQSLQEVNDSKPSISSSQATNKMLQSNSSIQSYRPYPSGKEQLQSTRRNTSSFKGNPLPSQRIIKSINPLNEKNY